MIYSFNDLVYSANSFYRCIDISRYIDTQHAYEVMYSAKRRDPFIIAAIDCNAAVGMRISNWFEISIYQQFKNCWYRQKHFARYIGNSKWRRYVDISAINIISLTFCFLMFISYACYYYWIWRVRRVRTPPQNKMSKQQTDVTFIVNRHSTA